MNCQRYNGHDPHCAVMQDMRTLATWFTTNWNEVFGADYEWRRIAVRFLSSRRLRESTDQEMLNNLLMRVQSPYYVVRTADLETAIAQHTASRSNERFVIGSLEEFRTIMVKILLALEPSNTQDRKLSRKFIAVWKNSGCSALLKKCFFGSIVNLPVPDFLEYVQKPSGTRLKGFDPQTIYVAPKDLSIDGIAEAEASVGLTRDLDYLKEPENVQDPPDWIDKVRRILKKVLGLEEARPFSSRVVGVAGYYEIIKQPMDLKTMLRKLNSRAYVDCSAVNDDFELIVDNCKTFNGQNPFESWVTHAVMVVQRLWQSDWVACGLRANISRCKFIEQKRKELYTNSDAARLGRLGSIALGVKLEIYSQEERKYISGEIIAYDEWFGYHHVKYVDGFIEVLQLVDERVRIRTLTPKAQEIFPFLLSYPALAPKKQRRKSEVTEPEQVVEEEPARPVVENAVEPEVISSDTKQKRKGRVKASEAPVVEPKLVPIEPPVSHKRRAREDKIDDNPGDSKKIKVLIKNLSTKGKRAGAVIAAPEQPARSVSHGDADSSHKRRPGRPRKNVNPVAEKPIAEVPPPSKFGRRRQSNKAKAVIPVEKIEAPIRKNVQGRRKGKGRKGNSEAKLEKEPDFFDLTGGLHQLEIDPATAPVMSGKQKRILKHSEFDSIMSLGHAAVGMRVEVYWRLDEAWYPGTVASCEPRPRNLRVAYDDGDVLLVDPTEEAVRKETKLR